MSIDYLLCRTKNREQVNTPLTELHLSDEMVALLKILHLTTFRKPGNVILSNCFYNRLQQEEKSMEWIAAIQQAITYMEEHIMEAHH